jgi:hypothetical protein
VVGETTCTQVQPCVVHCAQALAAVSPNGLFSTQRRESTLTHGLEPPCTACGWRNHVQPVHPCVVHCAPQALAVRSQNGSFQHNCPVRHCSHTGLNPVYCAKAHLPDSPPPFFLCAWATPLRGTSVTLGRRAHSPDKQVGGGGKPLDTLSEVLPGEAGLQITDLNPRPAAQNSPKGSTSGGPAEPRLTNG